MRRVILTSAVLVCLAASASADPSVNWTAYNDCMGSGGDPSASHITYYMTYDEDVLDGINNVGWTKNPTGLLMDYSTGQWTGVTATMTGYNLYPWGSSGTPPTGSAAEAVFGGIVNLSEFQSYYSTNYGEYWYYTVTFTGLDPNATYEFVTTANRGNPSYDGKRWAKYSILGADAYANESTGTVAELAGPGVLAMDTGYNGDIVKWTGVAAADGSFSVVSENIGAPPAYGTEAFKSYGMQAFQITELEGQIVPVPGAVGLGLAGMGLIGFWKRRKR